MGNEPLSDSSGAGLPISHGVWKNAKIRYRTDRLVIKLSPDKSAPSPNLDSLLQKILNDVPGTICLRKSNRTGRVVLGVSEGMDVLSLATQLNSRNDIEYAEPDIIDNGATDNAQNKGGI